MTTVHVDWGVAGARALAERCDIVAVVDVLSFSTTVTVALARGIRVRPHPWPLPDVRGADAARIADEAGAVVAGPRGSGVSLSPASVRSLAPGSALVLPSPNGAACCLAAAESAVDVVVACLRNAPAVSGWLHAQQRDVGIVAAGERWPDDSLRPAYEDWVGAGVIVDLLGDAVTRTPEAAAAAAAARERRFLAEVPSGIELIEAGYDDDIAMAEAFGVDDVIPRLTQGWFEPA